MQIKMRAESVFICMHLRLKILIPSRPDRRGKGGILTIKALLREEAMMVRRRVEY